MGLYDTEYPIKAAKGRLSASPKAVEGLITGRYPPEAYADLLSGKVHGIKNVVAL